MELMVTMFSGTSRSDVISGRGGSDTMIGGSGQDTLDGRDSVKNIDFLHGGTGDTDKCYGDPDRTHEC